MDLSQHLSSHQLQESNLLQSGQEISKHLLVQHFS
jgi:hypothetical protein